MKHAILSSGRNALRRGLVGRKVVITGAARGIGEKSHGLRSCEAPGWR